MSSSYITYKDRGFEAKDAGIECWLGILGREITVDPRVPGWVKELGEYWCGEAVECYGCAAPRVEEELDGHDDISPLIEIAAHALTRLESLEASGEKQVSIERFGLHSDDPLANQPMSLRYVVEVARAFVALLDGTLPPDNHPYPFVDQSGLIRYPQHPGKPLVADRDRKAYLTTQLPVGGLDDARQGVEHLFGIHFERSKKSWEGIYVAARGTEKFSLGVNSDLNDAEGKHYGRHYQAGAIMLEIETTVSHCAEYEQQLRAYFSTLPAKVLKIYFPGGA